MIFVGKFINHFHFIILEIHPFLLLLFHSNVKQIKLKPSNHQHLNQFLNPVIRLLDYLTLKFVFENLLILNFGHFIYFVLINHQHLNNFQFKCSVNYYLLEFLLNCLLRLHLRYSLTIQDHLLFNSFLLLKFECFFLWWNLVCFIFWSNLHFHSSKPILFCLIQISDLNLNEHIAQNLRTNFLALHYIQIAFRN